MQKLCAICGVPFNALRSAKYCPDHASVSAKGYRRIKVNGRLAMEHRIVMERKMGRKLRKTEVVHHKNGNRLDNREENLEVLSSHSSHLRHHQEKARFRCANCDREFSAKPSMRQRFCSRRCAGLDKLSLEDRAVIRAAYPWRYGGKTVLLRRFGVTHTALDAIVGDLRQAQKARHRRSDRD